MDGSPHVERLLDAVPDVDADMLAARQLAAFTSALGHAPSVDELRAAMLGASYVQEVAFIVGLPPGVAATVRGAAEAAMSVWAWNVEVAFHDQEMG